SSSARRMAAWIRSSSSTVRIRAPTTRNHACSAARSGANRPGSSGNARFVGKSVPGVAGARGSVQKTEDGVETGDLEHAGGHLAGGPDGERPSGIAQAPVGPHQEGEAVRVDEPDRRQVSDHPYAIAD